MKKTLKWTGLSLGILLSLLILFGLYVNFSPLKTYEVAAPNLEVGSDSFSLTNGKEIVQSLCMQCHLSERGDLSGAFMEEGALGKIYAPNITQHPTAGIGEYTDGELLYLLRTGVTRDGRYTPPFMVKLPHISDEDIQDVVAFIKSDDPLVRPSDHVVPEVEYSFLAKMLLKLGAFGPLPYPESPIIAPSPENEIEFGKYLAVGVHDCFGCHSADFAKVDLMEPEKSMGYFGGGNEFTIPGPDGDAVVRSANLTFDTATGIGTWSKKDFVKAIKMGVKPDHTALKSPMRIYTELTDEEAGAIYEYLKSIPIIRNEMLLAKTY